MPFDTVENVQVWLDREKDLRIDVHVVWKRGFTKDGRQEDVYDDWLKAQQKCKIIQDDDAAA